MSTLAEQIAMAELDAQAARIAIPTLWMSREADERLATRIAILASLRSLEAAQKDAARYRFLRNEGVPELCATINGYPSYIGEIPGNVGVRLDTSIDTAAKEQPK